MLRNKYNIIIDTNVIISALATSKQSSPVVKVLDLFYNRKVTVYYSKDIFDAKLITGNIKHYPKKDYIMTAKDFITKVYKE